MPHHVVVAAGESCAALLAQLIAFPTDNPGGDEPALAHHLGKLLGERGADTVEVEMVPRPGAMGAYTFATFGTPRTLVNAHIDTVPASPGYSRPPHAAAVADGQIFGLGAADTKGAIAAILTALETTRPRDTAILFSGDEEQSGTVMRAFLDSGRARDTARAFACEPTARHVGIGHRGICALSATITGSGGHSSRADHLARPVVTLARLAVALDDLGRRYLSVGPANMTGLCMNVASLEGGTAFNVVPERATLTWSVRPPPGTDTDAVIAEMTAAAAAIDPAIAVTTTLSQPSFACTDEAGFRALMDDRVAGFSALDFWTEAALFEAAGIPACVVGPGDIAVAHAADEFVTVADLAWAVDFFTHLFQRAG